MRRPVYEAGDASKILKAVSGQSARHLRRSKLILKRSKNLVDIKASRYGLRRAIAFFIIWSIACDLIFTRTLGWSTAATPYNLARAGVVLAIGVAFAMIVGRRAETRFKAKQAPTL